MPDRPFRVVARDKKTNDVRQVYRVGDRFTRNGKAKGRKSLFSKTEARAATKWGERNGLAVWVTKSPFPFVIRDETTGWTKPELARRINELGRRRHRYIWMGEGLRTKHQQWVFRMAMLNGTGALAARCDTTYWGKHSWEQCKNAGPSQSNHATGDAADISVFQSGRSGAMTNVGNDGKCRSIMRDLGLCLPVPGEPWHAEIGTRWCA